MARIKRLILLNQMAGPLFRQLSEGLSEYYEDGCLLITGHPDSQGHSDKLSIKVAPPYRRDSKWTRVTSWIHYVFSITGDLLRLQKEEYVLITSNPPLLGFWIYILGYVKKIRYAVLIYDIHPEVYEELGVIKRGGIIANFWRFINKLVFRRASVVITIGSQMAEHLKMYDSLNSNKIVVIPPWVDSEIITPKHRAENKLTARFAPNADIVILYSGNMGASHDIDSMLGAAKILKDISGVMFLFIGEGEKYDDVLNFANKFKLENIAVFPFQPESLLPYTLSLADISLVSVDKGMEKLMLPSKTYYYMAAGSALIGVCNPDSELYDIIESSGAGVSVSPGNAGLLASAILEMINSRETLAGYKKAARTSIEEYYSIDRGVNHFYRTLNDVF